jgi:flagellar biosynthesis protein FlhG
LAQAADEIVVVTTPEPTAYSDAYACLRVLGRGREPQDLRLVVNRADDRTEATQVAKKIRSVTKRFLSFDPEYLGFVPEDAAFGSSVRSREPYLRLFPQRPAAACIARLAERLLSVPDPEPQEVGVSDGSRKVSNMEDAPA